MTLSSHSPLCVKNKPLTGEVPGDFKKKRNIASISKKGIKENLGLFSLKKRRLWKDLTVAFQYFTKTYK